MSNRVLVLSTVKFLLLYLRPLRADVGVGVGDVDVDVVVAAVGDVVGGTNVDVAVVDMVGITIVGDTVDANCGCVVNMTICCGWTMVTALFRDVTL